MAGPGVRRKKHVISWDDFVAFAKATGRDSSHVFRVFKGERESKALADSFEQHFGFPMQDAFLSGRRKRKSDGASAA